jgi:hypothetical protein
MGAEMKEDIRTGDNQAGLKSRKIIACKEGMKEEMKSISQEM